ncbi:MAG: hypothetical protein LLG01_01550 [Planctomycetaceae bacterium]|nr:hypothetical protein [Planctomycetaceae bacterium]
MITFNCTHCSRQISALSDQSGRTIPCPACGQPLVVPRDTREPLESLADMMSEPGPIGPRRRRLPAKASGPNGAAVASFVLGLVCLTIPIVALLLVQFMCLGIAMVGVCAIVGGILGVTGYQQALRTRRGKALAIAGTIMCLVPMLLTILLFFRGRGI